MKPKTSSVEDQIIQATIECIEKYGISGATNRQIALEAGVNNAAINYYFRSKDVLIQRCMEITLTNAFDLSGMPPMPGVAAQERCIAILMSLVEGGFHYPGITRAHFFNLVAEGKYDPLLMKHLNRFIDELADDLVMRGCKLAQAELKLALSQIMSAAIMVTLAPTLFKGQSGIAFPDANTSLPFITRLVEKLLGETAEQA